MSAAFRGADGVRRETNSRKEKLLKERRGKRGVVKGNSIRQRGERRGYAAHGGGPQPPEKREVRNLGFPW